jgi:hypothetical protein
MVVEEVEVDGEVLLYDRERDEAHCLNGVTALVWRHADGSTPVDSLIERVRHASATAIDEDIIWSALESLSDAHLLVEPIHRSGAAILMESRRTMMKRVAAVGAITAGAAITSILAPTPAQAQTPTLPPDPGPD